MIVKCKYCGKEFNKKPSEIKKSKTGIFYCCKEHMNLDKNIGKSIVKCSVCGKEYEKKNSQIYENNFCSKECQKKFKPIVSLTCEQCGKYFEIDESYYRKQSKRGQTPKYCSNDCRHLARRTFDRIECRCDYCGKDIVAIDKNNTNHYCSQECRIAHVKEQGSIITTCTYCGKEIEKNKYAYDRAKIHFCNQKCYDAYRTNKKETYAEISHYLRTCEEYDRWRADIMARDHYKCTKCDSKDSLHVHHINQLYDICEKYNFDIDTIINSEEFLDRANGITLCTDCHALEHPYISRDEKGRFISRSKTKPQKS